MQRSTDIYEQNSACLDGITMMRGMAEIQRRAETINLVDKAKTGMELYSIRIAWQIRQWALDYAQRDYGRVKFADQVTFAINAVGAAVLKMAGATPMHVFIVAQGLTLREKKRPCAQNNAVSNHEQISLHESDHRHCRDAASRDVH